MGNAIKNVPAANRPKYRPIWDAAVNKFTAEFINDFCFPTGAIDWEELTEFTSGTKVIKNAIANVKAKEGIEF